MKLWILIFNILLIAMSGLAQAGEEEITPFGATCPACAAYGYCQKPLTYPQAVKNLQDYYAQKQLHVTVAKSSGRFLQAEIYRNGKMIEKVILDRRTGRIKTIH